MAIGLVGSPTTFTSGATSTTTITLNVPAGVVNGQLLLAVLTIDGGSSATITPPAGWTLANRTNSSTLIAQGLYYRIANTEPASYSWTTSNRNSSAVMAAYSGVDPNTPLIGVATRASTSTTSSLAGATVSPANETAFALEFVSTRNTTAAVTVNTVSSGYTLRADVSNTASAWMETILEDNNIFTAPVRGHTVGTMTVSASVTDQVECAVCLNPQVSSTKLAIEQMALGVGSGGTASTGTFSTGYANELLVAFIASDVAGDIVTDVSDTAGLTWTAVINPGTANGGGVGIYYALAATQVVNDAVTATVTTATANVDIGLYCLVNAVSPYIGATVSNTSASGTPTTSLTTTANNSWVIAAGVASTSPVIGAATGSVISSAVGFVAGTAMAWAERMTNTGSPSGTAATVALAPVTVAYGQVAVEILAQANTLAPIQSEITLLGNG